MSFTQEREQARASDPSQSVWVEANAGSGKTHVLVERIARLLLSGSAPDRLLCLTFTRAAAAEMSARLFKRLGQWTLASDDVLDRELTTLTGAVPDLDLRERARRLFAQAIESPGGLRIQTIHAFCERILKRFPLEAQVVPQFSVVDEETTRALLDDAREIVLRQAVRGDELLSRAISATTEQVGEESFVTLVRQAAGKRRWLEPFLRDKSYDDIRFALFAALQLPKRATQDLLDEQTLRLIDVHALAKLVGALRGSSVNDQKRAADLEPLLNAQTAESIARFEDAFFTKNGEPRKAVATKSLLTKFPELEALIETLFEIASNSRSRRHALFIGHASAQLFYVVARVLKVYAELKVQHALLDYEDLIAHAVGLFETPGAAWVLYKLDGGVDHILVDEAQDTSGEQWDIVMSIAREFFAGLGAERRGGAEIRTLFAVGDVKQSIMSFQGAEPEGFHVTRKSLEKLVLGAGSDFDVVPLLRSYRSAPKILQFVDKVFSLPHACDGLSFEGHPVKHHGFRKDFDGVIDIWPAVPWPDVPQAIAWNAPRDRVTAQDPAVTLANTIAKRVRGWIENGESVFDRSNSEFRAMRPGDVLVLVRRRGVLAEELIRQFKQVGLPVAGADRLRLTEHIAVMDLIALGRFALLPEDDLNLACVLKGPMCGLSEEGLFELAHPRPEGTSLWHMLEMRRSEPQFAVAHAFLDRTWRMADVLPPYEFYSAVLSKENGWKKILTRLGQEAVDPIDEFMNAALGFEQSQTPSLEGFLHLIEGSETEIKRDQDRADDAVRVMTVHGAKGLEAPVVLLPDTCSTPENGRHDEPFFRSEGDVPLWKVSSARDESVRAALRAEGVVDRMQEYRRLLYVALTRARDRLIICGYEAKGKGNTASARDENCWYDLVLEGAALMDATEVTLSDGEKIRRIGQARSPVKSGLGTAPVQLDAALPSWLTRPATPERERPHLTPSKARPSRSLPHGGEQKAMAFGRAVHRALEALSQAAPPQWSEIARTAISSELSEAAEVQSALAEALRVRRQSELSFLFGPHSYGEVALRGQFDWRAIPSEAGGRIDRIVDLGDKVLIVEFKTDRNVPVSVSSLKGDYLRQLAIYREMAKSLFSPRPVSCGILWTATAQLMEIDASLLDREVVALDP